MSDLRVKLLEIVQDGEAFTEATTDMVLDAVIAALPKQNKPYFSDDSGAAKFALGYNQSLKDVKYVLNAAKEGK